MRSASFAIPGYKISTLLIFQFLVALFDIPLTKGHSKEWIGIEPISLVSRLKSSKFAVRN